MTEKVTQSKLTDKGYLPMNSNLENMLPEEYPILEIYPSHNPRKPITIKGNKEGLMTLVFTAIYAMVSNSSSGEIFDGEGEVKELQIKVVQTYKELEKEPS
jgi:hypothetical protein